MRRRTSAVAFLLVCACSSGKSSSQPTTTTRPAYTPVFAKGPCNDEVPADPRIECGTLTVPEDRSKPSGRQVVLPVATVHTADPNPAPDPVIYFSGGPGQAGLPEARAFLELKQTGNHDVIVFDQRGTGNAQPSLDCPEFHEASATILSKADPYEVEQKVALDSMVACRDRLRSQGIDLNQYNTTATADDVADLRTAMGIEQWNYFGVSYGTTVALISMRNHPEGVRSAVIDSVSPPAVNVKASTLDAGYQYVTRELFNGCAQDPICHGAFPNLESDVKSLIATFNANPYQATIDNPVLKRSQHISLTGNDIAIGITFALAQSSLIPQTPFLFEQIKAGNTAILDQVAIQGLDFIDSLAEGANASVNCADRGAISGGDDPQQVLKVHPEESTLLLISPLFCDFWNVTTAPAGFNDPVRSDLPTLVLADQYDQATPPYDAKTAADTLSHSTFVEFPGLGHGAVFSGNPCPLSIFKAFLADPTAKVDTACVASMGPPRWVTG